jgi:hypothetical protein
MRRLFALAALVMFIFALIAAARSAGTFLTRLQRGCRESPGR